MKKIYIKICILFLLLINIQTAVFCEGTNNTQPNWYTKNKKNTQKTFNRSKNWTVKTSKRFANWSSKHVIKPTVNGTKKVYNNVKDFTKSTYQKTTQNKEQKNNNKNTGK